jgi:hypothetical protein
MTDRRDIQSETGARSDRDPEVSAEVIKDLDAPTEETDKIKGGKCVLIDPDHNTTRLA